MAELNVSRKNISKLFVDMQNKKFLVPEYQRPYKWDEEKCDILWDDITNFHSTKNDTDEYFLGTVVTYKNDNYNETINDQVIRIPAIEIIDGQQRVTSFFLLLRAFYKRLEEMVENANVKGLKNQIAPCIWDINPISQEVSDKKKIHIASLVATDEDKAIFHSILETGTVKDNATDLYSKNFSFFYKMCKQYAEAEPLQWESLCVTILQKCIVLPIECDVQDTALTIFSTLNDRGMPLADSDIFKAQIYKSKPSEQDKKDFTNVWKELTSTCKSASISLDDVFRFYSHTLRAKNNDKTKEIGLRKFYAQNQYEKLKSATLIDDLLIITDFWLYINANKKNDEITFDISTESRKYLHCLSLYPNEFWKYITTVFYLKNKNDEKFSDKFTIFLKKLTAFLFIKFIEKPTVNAIKDEVYQMCIAAQQGNTIGFNLIINEDELKSRIRLYSSSKLTRALILLHAYLNDNQIDLLPITFDIEHIFPKKWQSTNYFGWEEKDAQIYLEKFGNKVAFEKKLNIQAGNGYFGNKKQKYSQSKIHDVLYLANLEQTDWVKNDIEKREDSFIEKLISHFKELLS
jgi:uncharacterized protein with ParB-like and HNH nuclease domain